jgi:hypothetical protein
VAQLLVRNLEDAVVQALRQKAAEEGTSLGWFGSVDSEDLFTRNGAEKPFGF